MPDKTTLRNAGIALVLIALAGGALLYFNLDTSPNNNAPEATQKTGGATLTIDGLLEKQEEMIVVGETVLELMYSVGARNSELEITTKEYSGLGVLVVGIGEVQNGTDGKYWQYKVNGVMPQVGADAYLLEDGDAVEWFFAASQE